MKILHYLGTVSLSKNPSKMATPEIKIVTVDGYPKIEGAQAVLYCDLRTQVSMGDHDAVFFDVVKVEFNEVFTPRPRVRDYKCILHIGGSDYTSSTDSVVSFDKGRITN